MSERERMMKLLAANPATLAKVDSVLNGTDGVFALAEGDINIFDFQQDFLAGFIARTMLRERGSRGRLFVQFFICHDSTLSFLRYAGI